MIDSAKYKNEYKNLKDIVEQKLDEFVPVKYPEEIYNSMKYSLNAGGKRLRPVMTLEVCKMISGDYEAAIPTACARRPARSFPNRGLCAAARDTATGNSCSV